MFTYSSEKAMKAVLKLEGLCCANCAAKIENAVQKIDGIEEANLSFMTQKLTIQAPDAEMDRIVDEATRIAKRIEDEVIVKRLK